MRTWKISTALAMAPAILALITSLAIPSAAQQETILHSFTYDGVDGVEPQAGLILDKNGNFYGTTIGGGGNTDICVFDGCGTVFELSPGKGRTWNESILHHFHRNGVDGFYPVAGLTMDASGNLYGVTAAGGPGTGTPTCCGVAFELSPGKAGEWTEKILHGFGVIPGDGVGPVGGLIFDSHGSLYGTTPGGGRYGVGTVFRLTPETEGLWSYTILHDFDNTEVNGLGPISDLVFDSSGNLYGTTLGGGAYSYGAVFELEHLKNGDWNEHTLYSFNAGIDGWGPYANLIFDRSGDLYGTVADGGEYGCGAVFELARSGGSWAESVLYSFDFVSGATSPDGCASFSGLIFDGSGNLYGTTTTGGSNGCRLGLGCGVVFELSPQGGGRWSESIVHSFNDNGLDGVEPYYGSLVMDASGNLYGTTSQGGSSLDCTTGCGAVFGIAP
jgi:uncharacterized repeat protein (TIGR03803 family)